MPFPKYEFLGLSFSVECIDEFGFIPRSGPTLGLVFL